MYAEPTLVYPDGVSSSGFRQSNVSAERPLTTQSSPDQRTSQKVDDSFTDAGDLANSTDSDEISNIEAGVFNLQTDEMGPPPMA